MLAVKFNGQRAERTAVATGNSDEVQVVIDTKEVDWVLTSTARNRTPFNAMVNFMITKGD